MAKEFLVKAGETRRILWLLSSSIPGQVRFRAEAVDGEPPAGTVELARRRWFDWHRETFPLRPQNVFDKGVSDSDYRVTVKPDRDTRIVFETRHFRAEYLFKILVALIVLAVLSPLVMYLILNARA